MTGGPFPEAAKVSDVLLQHFVKQSKWSQSQKEHLLPSHSQSWQTGQGVLGSPFLLKAWTISLCSPISVERQKAELGLRKWAGKAGKGISSASLLI